MPMSVTTTTDLDLDGLPDPVPRETVAELALAAAQRASADLVAAWRATSGLPGTELSRARLVVARSRIRMVPTTVAVRQGRDLARLADTREAQVRTGLRLLASATAWQKRGRALARRGKLRRTLTASERAAVLDGHQATPEQLAMIDELGVGAPTVLYLNDEVFALVEAQLQAQLDVVARLRLTAELSVFAAHERHRHTDKTSLSDAVAAASGARTTLHRELRLLYRRLRATNASDQQVAQLAEVLALNARGAARDLAPIAVGLHQWPRTGRTSLRYRDDVAAASIAVASAIRTALLAYAVSIRVAAVFGAGLDGSTQRWRTAARELPKGSPSVLDFAPGAGLTRVRGITESIDDVQVNATKRIAILRIRRGPSSATTVVLPYFNPRYVGVRAGTMVDLRVSRSADVLAEFTNANTTTAIAALRQRFGTAAGGIVDRRDLADEASSSWLAWLVRECRPTYDALPDSINGSWSLGGWFALSVASGSLY